MQIAPRWVEIRSRVAILVPFPEEGEQLPCLPKNFWLGRVVSNAPQQVPDNRHLLSKAWICRNTLYDYPSLHLKARNQTRKAIKLGAVVEQIGWDEAWPHLPALVDDTFVRQGRSAAQQFVIYLRELMKIDREEWQGSIELWIVRKGDICGAFLIGAKCGNTYHILHQLSISSELEWCPNNLLTFHVVQRSFAELECSQVNYGVDGLDSGKLDGLARFKERMGFSLLPCQEHYIGKPGIILMVKWASWWAKALTRWLPYFERYDSLRQLRMLGKRIKITSLYCGAAKAAGFKK